MSSKENLKDALTRSKKVNTEISRQLTVANKQIHDLRIEQTKLKLTIAFLREERKPRIVKWFNKIIMKIWLAKDGSLK